MLFEVFVLTAIGGGSIFIVDKLIPARAEENSSLTWEEKERLGALKRLLKEEWSHVSSDKKISITEINEIRLIVSYTYKSVIYAFYYQNKVDPFVHLTWNKEERRITKQTVRKLNQASTDVQDVLDALAKKISGYHDEKGRTSSFLSLDVDVQYGQLTSRLVQLKTNGELNDQETEELVHRVEPLLHDAMQQFKALPWNNKSAYTDKTLKIFHAIESKINDLEAAAEKHKHVRLDRIFSEIEVQAAQLTKGRESE